MARSDFVHLHTHSEYSILDGAIRIKELPKRVKELGMTAIALTDHGAMFGAIDFYKECKKNGVKPIIGCEVYVAPRSLKDKDPVLDKKPYHLILLAKNEKGYKNLCKLVSISYLDGYYYKPRIDRKLLEEYHEGLICLSACLAGEVSSAILDNDFQKAKDTVLFYKNLFKDDYYLEIQNNGLAKQVLVNQKIIELARELNVKLVGTNDAHYLNKEDSYNHEVLLCIQTGSRMSDENRMRFETNELYVKSPEEMNEFFSEIPEAISNTVEIANKCNLEFEFGNIILPNYDVPQKYSSHYEYFEELVYNGIKKRYGENYNKQVLDRTKYELSVIQKMGYVDYFLIVWDYINFAHTKGIPVGPGRGSGAGSIVAYAIGITDIDPLRYNLLFERFLNPERISMPDFDVDFCTDRRQEVIDYVCQKYGKDHVSQIITFGTLSARMVIRDVSRVLDIPYAEADKLAKMVPEGPHITIKQALEQNSELNSLYENDSEIKNILDIAISLEGMPRQASTHACGIVITQKEVDSYVPLYVRDGQISTQYIMTTLEELGLLKMDFLGLRNLTVIQETIDLVKKNQNIDVVFDNEMNDQKVFKLWQNGLTTGIFQFESPGITSFMKELKPDSLEDIIAGVSLYRPGPMDQIPRYIQNKKDMAHAIFTHEKLKPILSVTYGCMVYQEQVMQIVRDLAGYSLGRADLVRRAMGKKKIDVMEKERQIFIYGKTDENGNIEIPGCIRNGIDEKSANKIFDEMAEFAKYAFNKSHAAAYAVVSYRTAYLKTYYPKEFLAATLNSYLGKLEKVSSYIEDAKRFSIEILPPSINKSETKFSVQSNAIRFGLGVIKNIGTQVIDRIILEREKNGEFTSFINFIERTKDLSINKKCIESLIKAGAFKEEFSQTTATLLDSYENIIDMYAQNEKNTLKGQVTIFDIGSDEKEKEELKFKFEDKEELPKKILSQMEKEMLGIYVTDHPLKDIEDKIKKYSTIYSKDINNDEEDELNKQKLKDGQIVKMIGIVNNFSKKITKSNKMIAFAELEDFYGTINLLCFENIITKYQDLLVEDNIVKVEGKLSITDGRENTVIVQNVYPIDEKENLHLYINISNLDETKKGELRGYLRKFRNENINQDEVFVIEGNEEKSCGEISISAQNISTIKKIVGTENVIFK